MALNRELKDWPVDYHVMVTEYEISQRYEQLFQAFRSGSVPWVDGFLAMGEEILKVPATSWDRRWLRARMRFDLADIKFEAFAAKAPAFGSKPEEVLCEVCEGYLQSHREFNGLLADIENGALSCSQETREVISTMVASMCGVTAEQILCLVLLCENDQWRKQNELPDVHLSVSREDALARLPLITKVKSTHKSLREMLRGGWHIKFNWNEAVMLLACGCVADKAYSKRYQEDLTKTLQAVAADVDETLIEKKVTDLEMLPSTKYLVSRGLIAPGWIRAVMAGAGSFTKKRKDMQATISPLLLVGVLVGNLLATAVSGLVQQGSVAPASELTKPAAVMLAGPGGTRPGGPA
jgi:hypothetical protein